MAIKREIIDGTKILNEIESSNITRTEYDTVTKKMIAEFKNGVRYEHTQNSECLNHRANSSILRYQKNSSIRK
jgi:hypothetical protein